MRPAGFACVSLAALTAASCSPLPSIGEPVTTVDDVVVRPVCVPRGTPDDDDLGRAFAGCRPGDVVLAAPPGVREATILAARVCDFGWEVVVRRRDEPGGGAVLACAYAGRVRPVPG
jgi:hypothetical protein